jgi:hypothetical protein
MRDDGMADESDFEVLPAEEMRKKYGLTAENRPTIRLDPSRVPERLRHLIPIAELYGISDDLIREDLLSKTPPGDLAELRRLVQEHDDLLDDWLAGPAAHGPSFSAEYVAFTCMRMAADGC